MSTVSPARAAAFQILRTVERGQAHSDDLLRGRALAALSDTDRNLATALVLGVLRWQICLDHEIRSLLARPNAKLDPEVRIALRLGAFQLRYMDRIPAHAAIDESVELVKTAGHHFASRMVNAVLRKLSAPRPQLTGKTPEELALSLAHPAWMVERWAVFFGLEATRAICEHGQHQPVTVIRLEKPEVAEELAKAGIQLAPGELLKAARLVTEGDVTATTAFREGRVRLQDEGSQLIAEMAGRGEEILDCCAAPGGKTLILAGRNPQAHIVAREANPQRLEQLRERLSGLADRIEFQLGDAAELTEEDRFDAVLTDVPCSGTGTLGRNPEIRHRLKVEDLPRQAIRQTAILRAAVRAVRPGGQIVYSTCSLEPEENEQMVAAVLASNPRMQIIPAQRRIDELEIEGSLQPDAAEKLGQCVTQEGFLRLLPGALHTDGFFVAILEKFRD